MVAGVLPATSKVSGISGIVASGIQAGRVGSGELARKGEHLRLGLSSL